MIRWDPCKGDSLQRAGHGGFLSDPVVWRWGHDEDVLDVARRGRGPLEFSAVLESRLLMLSTRTRPFLEEEEPFVPIPSL